MKTELSESQLSYFVEHGRRSFENGISFARWSDRMIIVHGNEVVPYLRETWHCIKAEVSPTPAKIISKNWENAFPKERYIFGILRRMKDPVWISSVALVISLLALLLAILAWQKPIVVNNNFQHSPPERSTHLRLFSR